MVGKQKALDNQPKTELVFIKENGNQIVKANWFEAREYLKDLSQRRGVEFRRARYKRIMEAIVSGELEHSSPFLPTHSGDLVAYNSRDEVFDLKKGFEGGYPRQFRLKPEFIPKNAVGLGKALIIDHPQDISWDPEISFYLELSPLPFQIRVVDEFPRVYMFAGKPDPGTWLPVPAEKSYVFMARLEVKGIPLELLSDDRQGGFTPFGIGFHREGSYMDNIYAVEARDTVVSIDKKYPIIAERPISGKWD